MFLAPGLYVIYALLYGIFTMITVALGDVYKRQAFFDCMKIRCLSYELLMVYPMHIRLLFF